MKKIFSEKVTVESLSQLDSSTVFIVRLTDPSLTVRAVCKGLDELFDFFRSREEFVRSLEAAYDWKEAED